MQPNVPVCSRHLSLGGHPHILLKWSLLLAFIFIFHHGITMSHSQVTNGIVEDSAVNYLYPRTSRGKTLDCICGKMNAIPSSVTQELPEPPPLHRKNYHEYPWQVLIFRSIDGKLPAIHEPVHDPCGGSIINDRTILTSANCIWPPHFDWQNSDHIKNILFMHKSPEITNVFKKDLKVVYIDEQKRVNELEVEDVAYLNEFALEKFSGRDIDWDVGLIKLKHPLAFSDETGLRPICLPSHDYFSNSLTGQTASLLIWSYQDGGHDNTDSFHLPELSLNKTFIHSLVDCRVNTWNRFLTKRFLCMETKRSSVEATHKGYPVMIHNNDNLIFQVGVTSWTSGYGRIRNMPDADVFSNLAYFLGFIETKSNEWGAKWCSKEPEFNMPPVSNSFNPNLLTAQGLGLKHPWAGLTSASRTEMSCRCGIKNVPSRSNIDRVPLSFGWNAKIVISRGETQGNCEGSIVNDRVVIASAHCFFDPDTDVRDEAKNIAVFLYCDENYKSDRESCDKRRGIHELIRFPDYNDWDETNDIALLILDEAIDFHYFRNKITPLCIPKTWAKLKFNERKDALVTRWITFDDSLISLSPLSAEILNENECQNLTRLYERATGKSHFKIPVGPDLCVNVIPTSNGRKVGYQSGSLVLPRIQNSPNKSVKSVQFFQAGVMSYGVAWGQRGPSTLHILEAFTNVQEYISFIEYYSLYHGAKWCSL